MSFSAQAVSEIPGSSAVLKTLASWQEILAPAINDLQLMAGATEDEFLHIGSQLQSFYQRSVDISRMAGQLLEIVSGERLQILIERLQQMMSDMEQYLSGARSRSGDNRNNADFK